MSTTSLPPEVLAKAARLNAVVVVSLVDGQTHYIYKIKSSASREGGCKRFGMIFDELYEPVPGGRRHRRHYHTDIYEPE